MKPTLKKAWSSWKTLSKRIGNFQARIIFSILYFIAVTPVGFFMKKINNRSSTKKKTCWLDYTGMPTTIDEMKQQ